jgi:hypothetical protein
LGLDSTDVQNEFFGFGGGTLRPGLKCVQKQEIMTIIESNKPTTVFLQVGGNDLSYENNPDKLARDIISFADYVIMCYDVHHMIIDQLLPRYSEKPEMNYNQRLSRACIVHLVIKKTNWSYVKTMSCVILELRST